MASLASPGESVVIHQGVEHVEPELTCRHHAFVDREERSRLGRFSGGPVSITSLSHSDLPVRCSAVTVAGGAPAVAVDSCEGAATGGAALTTGRSRPFARTEDKSWLTLAVLVCSSSSLGRFQLVVAVDQRKPFSFRVLCRADAVLDTPTTAVVSDVWWIRRPSLCSGDAPKFVGSAMYDEVPVTWTRTCDGWWRRKSLLRRHRWPLGTSPARARSC